ncbi:hypothetical protein F4803DRAFT_504595 [Xylaria telfairii]|nr:hypothetical protein F4803DRAFT_504595 [Xylaria telfairii]
MLTFALLSGVLVWNVVLTFHILHNWRFFLRVLRWSTTLYLVILGVLAAEVLREGLIVNGSTVLHWDVRLVWTVWYMLVAASALDWRFLVPAAALPLWFLSYPEVRTLLDYGLVRLGWVGVVHSPLSWAASRPKMLELGIRAHMAVDQVLGHVVIPVLRPVRSFTDYLIDWALWMTDRSWDKLRPPSAWNGLPLARY